MGLGSGDWQRFLAHLATSSNLYEVIDIFWRVYDSIEQREKVELETILTESQGLKQKGPAFLHIILLSESDWVGAHPQSFRPQTVRQT